MTNSPKWLLLIREVIYIVSFFPQNALEDMDKNLEEDEKVVKALENKHDAMKDKLLVEVCLCLCWLVSSNVSFAK